MSHEIYVASLGGYSTGQELLKTMRHVKRINPDIHISYSGANECLNSSYVSDYLYNVLNNVVNKRYRFLPNIFMFIYSKVSDVVLKEPIYYAPEDYWYDNTQLMYAIATQYNYKFYPIIQPVAGVGKVQYDNDYRNKSQSNYIDCYKNTYHNMFKKIEIEKKVRYVDFTQIFDTITDIVFKDNCHIYDQFQPLVAKSILDSTLINDFSFLFTSSSEVK